MAERSKTFRPTATFAVVRASPRLLAPQARTASSKSRRAMEGEGKIRAPRDPRHRRRLDEVARVLLDRSLGICSNSRSRRPRRTGGKFSSLQSFENSQNAKILARHPRRAPLTASTRSRVVSSSDRPSVSTELSALPKEPLTLVRIEVEPAIALRLPGRSSPCSNNPLMSIAGGAFSQSCGNGSVDELSPSGSRPTGVGTCPFQADVSASSCAMK
jgi:hypothetical protein